VPIVDRWSAGKAPDAWLFDAPEGGPLRESNWKRSVGWSAATAAAGVPGFRVHDLRHTAASVWLAAGADPKVVQRVLGHASAAMTMDLCGPWSTAICGRLRGSSGASRGHLSCPGCPSQTAARWRRTKVPGSGMLSDGAAYRNRTDDLRITRGMLRSLGPATCTDATRKCRHCTQNAGISRYPVPRPVPRPLVGGLAVPGSQSSDP
jgi:hypothetical protein